MKRNWTIRSLLILTLCVTVLLSLQLYAKRQAREFERDIAKLSVSTQDRLMADSNILAAKDYEYPISDVKTVLHATALDYLFFRRRVKVTFKSTNHVNRYETHDWEHWSEYVFLPFRNYLDSNDALVYDWELNYPPITR